jgi:hypothetical protein
VQWPKINDKVLWDASQLRCLDVDRDGWLTGSLERRHFGVDVLEALLSFWGGTMGIAPLNPSYPYRAAT